MNGPIVLAAGGTGGHMNPARALADEFTTRGRELALFTDYRGDRIGGSLVDVETVQISSASLSGKRGKGHFQTLKMIIAGILQARRALIRLQPSAVIGFGGYPSLPTMLAAKLSGFPTLLHEQNAVLGRVNRFLAPWTTAIALSIANTDRVPRLTRQKVYVTGNPIRREVSDIRKKPYQVPSGDGPITLLVFGGSQGASVLSLIVPVAIARINQGLRSRLQVSQQCRPEDLATARSEYMKADVRADVAPYFSDLPKRLGSAHLVISRSGASTVAELAAAGRPALLVPYPSATDDHQTANARVLSDLGGAELILEEDFTSDGLAKKLDEILIDHEHLAATAKAASSIGLTNGAMNLANLVESVAESGHPQ